MKNRIILVLSSLALVGSVINVNNIKSVKAETDNEHALALTSGTLKMGGIYGTTSAYYKVKGEWISLNSEDYMASGHIVNRIPCSGSINMSYYANSESYISDNDGKVYGAIRVGSYDIPRIGSGSGQDGFIEYISKNNENYTWTSKAGNPVTLRYDASIQDRTLPDYYRSSRNVLGKGKASGLGSGALSYKGFSCDYFGIGWYYGDYKCDLTNVCFYDDNYDSLGIAIDNDQSDTTIGLYGREGSRIYVNYSDSDEILTGFIGVDNDGNTITIDGFNNEGNGIYSFIMPNKDVTISPKYKQTTINVIHEDEVIASNDIAWSKEELKEALDLSSYLGDYEKLVGYSFDNKLFKDSDSLYTYIKDNVTKSYEYDIELSTVTLKMNKQADFRTLIGSSGMRFTGKTKGDMHEYGMLVTKYKNLESLDKFTMEDMNSDKYRKVSSLQEGFKHYVEDGYNVFSSVITNMYDYNIVNEYLARLYCVVNYYDGTTTTIYSDIDESYLTMPYEAGLIAAERLDQDMVNHPENKDINELRKQFINKYYDPVCNIDNSYHLIGNGRNYTVEKVEDGKIKVIPLNDSFSIKDIRYLCLNGTPINFAIKGDVISFTAALIKPIEIKNPFNGNELELHDNVIKSYMNATTDEEVIPVLKQYSGQSHDKQLGTLSWKAVGSEIEYYILYLSEDEAFTNAISFTTKGSSITPGVLMPNTTYYYKVVAIKGNKVITQSDVDTFVTCNDLSLRQINASGTVNMRDNGGWITESGKTVNYGLLYRGACLNGHNGCKLTTDGLNTFNNILHIKSEIDFRTTGADDTDGSGKAQYKNAFNEDNPYVKATITQSCYIFPGWKQTTPTSRAYDSRTKSSMQAMFNLLSNKDNYPVYYHCNAGADRTGTMGYIFMGLLDVPLEDLIRDFELTSFSTMGKRWRSNIVNDMFTTDGVMQDDSNNYVAFLKMHNYMMDNYGTGDGKISSAIENYLVTAMMVPSSQIEQFKAIMLGD